jgi:hypothetical protein
LRFYWVFPQLKAIESKKLLIGFNPKPSCFEFKSVAEKSDILRAGAAASPAAHHRRVQRAAGGDTAIKKLRIVRLGFGTS